MMMTREQHQKLGEFFDHYGDDAIQFDTEDDGTLAVTIFSDSPSRCFERQVTPDGKIVRYDGDTDKTVPATIEPLKGSGELFARYARSRATHNAKSHYNY